MNGMTTDFLNEPANQEAYNRLQQALLEGRMIAFVGAGCSAPLHYPTWKGLLCKLIDKCKARPGVSLPDLDRRKQLVQQDKLDLLNLAEYCRTLLTDPFYFEFLEAEFGPKRGRGHTDEHETLFNLPFHRFMTSNFDSCLDSACQALKGELPQSFTYTDERLARFSQTSDQTRQWILHIHGRCHPSREIVLTETDYQQHYRRDDYRRTLETILVATPVLFIGFSLTDPDFKYLLRELSAIFKRRAQEHYALLLMPDDPVLVVSQRLEFEALNIRVVFYPVGLNHDHSARTRLLEELFAQYRIKLDGTIPAEIHTAMRELVDGKSRWKFLKADAPGAEDLNNLELFKFSNYVAAKDLDRILRVMKIPAQLWKSNFPETVTQEDLEGLMQDAAQRITQACLKRHIEFHLKNDPQRDPAKIDFDEKNLRDLFLRAILEIANVKRIWPFGAVSSAGPSFK